MSEHSRFEAVITEARSFLTLVEDNFERVWEDWAPYCVHRDNSGTLCMRDKDGKQNESANLCIFEDCPYVKDRS